MQVGSNNPYNYELAAGASSYPTPSWSSYTRTSSENNNLFAGNDTGVNGISGISNTSTQRVNASSKSAENPDLMGRMQRYDDSDIRPNSQSDEVGQNLYCLA